MPNKDAHAGLRLTASRGVPPCGAVEHQPSDCGCQQAIHNTLQTAWIAISRPDFDMDGLGAHSKLSLSRALLSYTKAKC